MKIACLQLEPVLGKVQHNMDHASAMIAHLRPEDVDVLVLPEMAFTGYVFTSKEHIKPYLEHAETGPSVEWAKTQAKRLSAHVQVGYPEKRISDKAGQPHEEFYNSVCFVSPDGKVLATYAKHFLYYTDENWAEEGPAFQSMSVQGLGQVGFGICMDVNPYKFQAPFTDFEFSSFHLSQKSNLMLCSMAWNKGEKTKVERGHKPETSKAESAETVDVNSDGDDDDDDNWEDEEDAESLQYETVQYWAVRMSPFYRQEQKPLHETIMVIANRIGSESGNLFVGSSCVLKLAKSGPVLLAVLPADREGVLQIEV